MRISNDLRERVVKAKENKEGTIEEIAKRFNVGPASVVRWYRLKRETGSIEPRPHGGGMPRSIDDTRLLKLVQEHSDYTIAELTENYFEGTGRKGSTSATSRALIRLGLSRKKKRFMQRNKKQSEFNA